jgi:hypothetical protein
MNKDNYYRVQNLYEASFLLAKGHKLVGKEKKENKVTLLFDATTGLVEDSLRFYNGAKIEAKALFDAYRTLKDFVFER